MRTDTFDAIMALVRDDPLTATQVELIGSFGEQRLVDVAEASRLFGVSPQTIRKQGIPVVRVGRRVLYRSRDLDAYIRRHTHEH